MEVNRRHLGGNASRKISRPSGRSRAKLTKICRIRSVVKDRWDWMTVSKNVGMWHRGSRGERKHSITPGDAKTFDNPECGASARLVSL